MKKKERNQISEQLPAAVAFAGFPVVVVLVEVVVMVMVVWYWI